MVEPWAPMPSGKETHRGIVTANAAIAHNAIKARKSAANTTTIFGSAVNTNEEGLSLMEDDIAYLDPDDSKQTAFLTSLNRISHFGSTPLSAVQTYAQTYFPNNPDEFVGEWLSENLRVVGICLESVTQGRAERPIRGTTEVAHTVAVRGTCRPPSVGNIYPGDFLTAVAKPYAYWDETEHDERADQNNGIGRNRNTLVLQRVDPRTFARRFSGYICSILKAGVADANVLKVLYPTIENYSRMTSWVSAMVSFVRFVAFVMVASRAAQHHKRDPRLHEPANARAMAISLGMLNNQEWSAHLPVIDAAAQLDYQQDVQAVIRYLFSHPTHHLGVANDMFEADPRVTGPQVNRLHTVFQEQPLRFFNEVFVSLYKNERVFGRAIEPSGAKHRAHVLM